MIAVTVIFTVLLTVMFIHLVYSKQYKVMPRWKFIWVAVFTIGIWVGDVIALATYLMNK